MAKKETWRQYNKVKVQFTNQAGAQKYKVVAEPKEDGTGTKPVKGKLFSYAESNTLYEEHLVWTVEDNLLKAVSPKRPIYIDIPRGFNVYNFESAKHKHTAQVIMNLLAAGHSVVLVDKDNGKQFRLGRPSLAFIDTQLLSQMKFIYVTKEWKTIKDPVLNQYMQDNFQTRTRAIKFLSSPHFAVQEKKHNRYFILKDMLREALMLRHEERLLDVQFELQERRLQALDKLRTSLFENDWDFLESIPNQDTWAALTPKIQVSLSFTAELKGTVREWTGSYVEVERGLAVSDIDRKEQALLNAYFYDNDEFRIPSRDDLQLEFEGLQRQYHALKASNPTRQEVLAFTDSYVRMLELSDRLNEEPHGNIDDYDSPEAVSVEALAFTKEVI